MIPSLLTGDNSRIWTSSQVSHPIDAPSHHLGSVSLAATKAAFSPEELEKRLVEWVACDDQPLTAVGSSKFRSLLELFKPDLRIPSATTIKDLVTLTCKTMKARIADRLCHAASKISLTLDWWTWPNTKAFLGITAHSIDKDWVPHPALASSCLAPSVRRAHG